MKLFYNNNNKHNKRMYFQVPNCMDKVGSKKIRVHKLRTDWWFTEDWHGSFFQKNAVQHGVDNCLGETRWFCSIYRNYAKMSFLERILTFNPAFEYCDFVFSNVFTLSADYFPYSVMRTCLYTTAIDNIFGKNSSFQVK